MPGRLLPMSLPTKFLQVHVYVNVYCIIIVKNIGPMQETCGLKGESGWWLRKGRALNLCLFASKQKNLMMKWTNGKDPFLQWYDLFSRELFWDFGRRPQVPKILGQTYIKQNKIVTWKNTSTDIKQIGTWTVDIAMYLKPSWKNSKDKQWRHVQASHYKHHSVAGKSTLPPNWNHAKCV